MIRNTTLYYPANRSEHSLTLNM